MMNNIFQSIIRTIIYTFTLSGRTNRKEFLIFQVFYSIIILLVIIIDKYTENLNLIVMLLYTIGVLISLFLLLLSQFSLMIRRLHDFDASGWWLLITFLPFGQLLMLWLIFKKGTKGLNKYGEPPEY